MQHNTISRDDFFYVLKDNYDEHIELAIPYYWEMHKELSRYVPSQRESLRVLDLGCGTGKTSAAILEGFPQATVLGIDLFAEMLRHAHTRLARFPGRVELRQGDFRTVDWGARFDLCVSALAIHHLTGTEKQELFRRIYESLSPQGRFVMIDWTKFHSPFVQNLAAQIAEQHAAASVPDQEVIREWCDHWRNKNIPDTVEDMLIWLRQAGFAQAECIVRFYGMAMICAEKK